MAIAEQANKKRKLEPAAVSRQASFTDLLTQLEAEEDASEGMSSVPLYCCGGCLAELPRFVRMTELM